jgi:uncharacterized protein (DUF1697 family)
MRTHIALLRGINVSGNNMIKMADLRSFFEDLGFQQVQTVLQSGNVVFQSDGRSTEELERLLEMESAERLGLRVGYFVRTGADWDAAVEANPFPEAAKDDPSHLLMICFPEAVDPAAIEAIQAANPGPELLRAVGKHLYITYPDGIGRSKLQTVPGWKTVGAPGTARNWNTVLKLQSLVRQLND